MQKTKNFIFCPQKFLHLPILIIISNKIVFFSFSYAIYLFHYHATFNFCVRVTSIPHLISFTPIIFCVITYLLRVSTIFLIFSTCNTLPCSSITSHYTSVLRCNPHSQSINLLNLISYLHVCIKVYRASFNPCIYFQTSFHMFFLSLSDILVTLKSPYLFRANFTSFLYNHFNTINKLNIVKEIHLHLVFLTILI